MLTYPKITVITPSYNQAKFLKATIQSVLKQNYANLQYIIIDGGSTDNSVEIIKEHKGQIDFWISESDLGQSDAINKGLSHANGDIVTWINSDDLLMPGALEAAALAWQVEPQLTLLSAECIRIGPANEFLGWHTVPRQLKWFAKRGLIYIDQPGTFWRRNIFHNTDVLNLDLNGLMDHDLWYRIALLGGKTSRIKQCTAAFRYHQDSKTTNIQNIFIEEGMKLRNKYCGELCPGNSLATLLYRIFKCFNGDYIRKFILTKKPGDKILTFLDSSKKNLLTTK